MINITAPIVNITINNPTADLGQINERLDKMATAQEQAAAELNRVGDTLDKVSIETTSLVMDVRTLKELVANNVATMSPELRGAIDRITSKANAIDALVDDVAPNPTDTPPEGGSPTAGGDVPVDTTPPVDGDPAATPPTGDVSSGS